MNQTRRFQLPAGTGEQQEYLDVKVMGNLLAVSLYSLSKNVSL